MLPGSYRGCLPSLHGLNDGGQLPSLCRRRRCILGKFFQGHFLWDGYWILHRVGVQTAFSFKRFSVSNSHTSQSVSTIMPTSISAFFGYLNCFSRKTDEVIIATTISCDGDSEGSEKLSRATNSPERTLQRLDNDSPSIKTYELPQSHKFPTNPALLVVAKGKYEVRESFSFPSLSHDGEVVIRTETVGLNPIDWKSVDYGFCLPDFPWITGREMAGTVERVGSEVTSLKVGQRVWTSKYPSTEHRMFTTTTLPITLSLK